MSALFVEATVFGAEKGSAAEVLGHVAGLCFDATDAEGAGANAEA